MNDKNEFYRVVASALVGLGVILMLIAAAVGASMLLTGCGDNTRPAIADAADDSPATPDAWEFPEGSLTIRDAERVWAEAWCTYAERCVPDKFAEIYASHEECVATVLAKNCMLRVQYGLKLCEEPFRDQDRDNLRQCYADMGNIACTATQAPTTCIAAFGMTSVAPNNDSLRSLTGGL